MIDKNIEIVARILTENKVSYEYACELLEALCQGYFVKGKISGMIKGEEIANKVIEKTFK